MLIYVLGVSFGNCGADLMLRAILEQVHSWQDTVEIAVDLRVGSFAERRALGTKTLCQLNVNKLSFMTPLSNCVGRAIPTTVRRRQGIALDSEIGAVLDASGFAYGDQWGPLGAVRMAARYRKWKMQGKKLVLLPQAFGPFQGKEIREAFGGMLRCADLVFARDSASYDYASAVGHYGTGIRLAPDFTNLVRGEVPGYAEEFRGQVALMPNKRMVAREAPLTRFEYLDFLRFCSFELAKKDIRCFIMLHDISDGPLARELLERCSPGTKIVTERSSINVKGLLQVCRFVIGSRYHGLAGALSQGVPAIGIGWSHKYKYLFKDYGVSEFVIEPTDGRDRVLTMMDFLVDPKNRQTVVERLKNSSLLQERATREMWKGVREILHL